MSMLLSTISENDADRLALIIHIDTWNDLAKKASGCIGTLPHTAQPSTSAEAQMCKLAGERGQCILSSLHTPIRQYSPASVAKGQFEIINPPPIAPR